MNLNLVTLLVSVIALVTSAWLAWSQLRSSRKSTVLAMILEGFRDTRGDDYLEAVEYVLYRLAVEHPQPVAYQQLPEESRRYIQRVGLFYNDLGKLVAHGLVDESLIIGAYGGSLLRAWNLLAPYVYLERQEHQRQPMRYFEDLAWRVSSRRPETVYRELGLHVLPPGTMQ
ncbi:DUF4760 domain-containing protein [Streptomyces purpurascens]|uniref:DUF4760 domain-containing protein n=1 Tax=Streptomyces purpurascens TaxID=1924 RepID=A0ABZ1MDA3_STREF|nr:hypothetical protein [Streptomyces purpurascens]MCE7048533.1 DUF4760 domain-containing protein [Streptomyces purpurascens]